MKQIITAILAVVFMGAVVSAQNTSISENTMRKESRTEAMTYIASLPDVSVTYLTKSMLQRLPKDRAESPLAVLVDKGGVESIRVFQLGSAAAEAGGKKLMDAYTSSVSYPEYAELLMLQNSASSEVVMYGFPIPKDTSYYYSVIMYSKTTGKKAILIILSGKIPENAIGDLVDSFSD